MAAPSHLRPTIIHRGRKRVPDKRVNLEKHCLNAVDVIKVHGDVTSGE
jgi:hypothetical protein